VQSLIERLLKRAEIRRNIASRKSVQEGKPDRISDLLEEAASKIKKLDGELEDAVQAVNTMQALLMQSGLLTNSSSISANVKLAFNRGAKFLSEHPDRQTAYLIKLYKSEKKE